MRTVALWVDDAKRSYEETIAAAISYMEPQKLDDENGYVTQSELEHIEILCIIY